MLWNLCHLIFLLLKLLLWNENIHKFYYAWRCRTLLFKAKREKYKIILNLFRIDTLKMSFCLLLVFTYAEWSLSSLDYYNGKWWWALAVIYHRRPRLDPTRSHSIWCSGKFSRLRLVISIESNIREILNLFIFLLLLLWIVFQLIKVNKLNNRD